MTIEIYVGDEKIANAISIEYRKPPFFGNDEGNPPLDSRMLSKHFKSINMSRRTHQKISESLSRLKQGTK